MDLPLPVSEVSPLSRTEEAFLDEVQAHLPIYLPTGPGAEAQSESIIVAVPLRLCYLQQPKISARRLPPLSRRHMNLHRI
jgi:hypothetical protein